MGSVKFRIFTAIIVVLIDLSWGWCCLLHNLFSSEVAGLIGCVVGAINWFGYLIVTKYIYR